ncbi:MAG: dockerin type I repeat-containing protein [Candidatus Zixiibacteriota bacterium]|nr:MAG: dockerin type I repeat-containing protein [candidate division Zixibacteria bacterium]
MRKILLIAVAFGLLPLSAALGQGVITLDHVEGLNASGGFDDGATLTFHLRLTNVGDTVVAMANGYKFTSDGISWGSLHGSFVGPLDYWVCWLWPPCPFDIQTVDYFPPNIVGFQAMTGPSGYGLPTGFDDVGCTITVGPLSVNNGTYLTLDSSFFPPAGPWTWLIEGGTAVHCEWGGPYTYYYIPQQPDTWLSQDPIYLKELVDRIIYVYFRPADVNDVDLCSVRVQDKIKTYSQDCAWIEGDLIVTDVFVFRLLSPYRPISGTVNTTYTVSWDTYSGDHYVLYGDLNVELYPGDVNLDGEVNASDLIFMSDYLFNAGPPSQLKEVMDIDQNGRVDALDMTALSRLIGF